MSPDRPTQRAHLANLARLGLAACIATLAAGTAAAQPAPSAVVWSPASLPGAAAALASRVEFVRAGTAPARRPEQGLLVLDLSGLESAEAALTLAQQWRQRQGPHVSLICWLQSPSRSEATEAVGVLLQAEAPPCSRVLVAR